MPKRISNWPSKTSNYTARKRPSMRKRISICKFRKRSTPCSRRKTSWQVKDRCCLRWPMARSWNRMTTSMV